MINIIDYIKDGRRKIARILAFLSGQLEVLQNGGDVDYLILLDAINFIETYPDLFLIPKENLLFDEFAEKYNFYGFNCLLNQYKAENKELKALTKSLREHINAVMSDVVIEKKSFEEKLDTCIQKEKEHLDTEMNTILPLVKLMLANEQIKNLSKIMQAESNAHNGINNIAITDKKFQLTKEEYPDTSKMN